MFPRHLLRDWSKEVQYKETPHSLIAKKADRGKVQPRLKFDEKMVRFIDMHHEEIVFGFKMVSCTIVESINIFPCTKMKLLAQEQTKKRSKMMHFSEDDPHSTF